MSLWPPPKEQWPAGFTAGNRGWYRSYKGQTRWVCSSAVPISNVVEKWVLKRRQIDGEDVAELIPVARTYRSVMSQFIDALEIRVATGKPRPLSPRTLHNYEIILNAFGQHVGGMTPIDEVRPEHFASFARKYAKWKASGYDSVISRVSALFNWAEEMDYLVKFRPGPQFARPPKSEIRSDRIDLSKSFTVQELAKLWKEANCTMRCWIGAGLCCGFINSDVAHLPREVVDLDQGIIDYRRRKTGKVRRVCPLPEVVLQEWRRYNRPEPMEREYAGYFFLTETGGVPYGGMEGGKPRDSVGRLFFEQQDRSEVEHMNGRNFSGLRTTLYNLWPRGEWDIERRIVMGRRMGPSRFAPIDIDHYLEDVGLERLRHCVNHVWSQIPLPVSIARAG